MEDILRRHRGEPSGPFTPAPAVSH
jgi:hypothetical protein